MFSNSCGGSEWCSVRPECETGSGEHCDEGIQGTV